MSLRVSPEEYSTLLARTGQASSLPPATPPPKPNKFGAIPKTVDGHTFQSSGEADRYLELKIESLAGTISQLRIQRPFDIVVNDIFICQWIADFIYLREGIEVVEDFKGHRTPEYKLKKKLVEALCGIQITETGVKRRRRK